MKPPSQVIDTTPKRLSKISEELGVSVRTLKEGLGYKLLCDKHGYDVAGIALKTGKSESYVYQRMKLCDLTEESKQRFEGGEINASVAVLLARLNEQDQAKVLERFKYDNPTVQEVKDYIKRSLYLRVINAPFPLDKPMGDAPACNKCPKRTSLSKSLFAEFEGDDLCTDSDCWNEKKRLNVESVTAEAKAQGIEVILVSTRDWTTRNGILGTSGYRQVNDSPDYQKPPKGVDEFHFEDGWDHGVGQDDIEAEIGYRKGEDSFDEKAFRAGYAAATEALAKMPSAVEVAKKEGCQIGITQDGDVIAIDVTQEAGRSVSTNGDRKKWEQKAKRETEFRALVLDAVREQIEGIDEVEIPHFTTALRYAGLAGATHTHQQVIWQILEDTFERECMCSSGYTPKLYALAHYAQSFGIDLKQMRKEFNKDNPSKKKPAKKAAKGKK